MKKNKGWTGPVVMQTDLGHLGAKRQGKVRDIYDLGDHLLLIASDRISAFDVVLAEGIPGKGYVLTQLSRFWFDWIDQMNDLVPHHLVTMDVRKFPEACQAHQEILEGRSMLVEKVRPLPVECIVRGYLSGSGWKEYKKAGTVCSQPLPSGLKESDRLAAPLFTPSTKADEGHDVNIDIPTMKKLVGDEMAERAQAASVQIYERAAAYAEARGIIIADTKFEFGIRPSTGELILIDEVLTPDSSRFWPLDEYRPGGGQPSFDKQFVRDYLDSVSWDHNPPPPHLPDEIVQKTSEKYFQALERLSGDR